MTIRPLMERARHYFFEFLNVLDKRLFSIRGKQDIGRVEDDLKRQQDGLEWQICSLGRPFWSLTMGQLFIRMRLLLVVCCNVALLSSALGQADRPEVGREVSRIQRPTLFPMVTGEGVEAAVVGRASGAQGIWTAKNPLRHTPSAMAYNPNFLWSVLHHQRCAASKQREGQLVFPAGLPFEFVKGLLQKLALPTCVVLSVLV